MDGVFPDEFALHRLGDRNLALLFFTLVGAEHEAVFGFYAFPGFHAVLIEVDDVDPGRFRAVSGGIEHFDVGAFGSLLDSDRRSANSRGEVGGPYGEKRSFGKGFEYPAPDFSGKNFGFGTVSDRRTYRNGGIGGEADDARIGKDDFGARVASNRNRFAYAYGISGRGYAPVFGDFAFRSVEIGDHFAECRFDSPALGYRSAPRDYLVFGSGRRFFAGSNRPNENSCQDGRGRPCADLHRR